MGRTSLKCKLAGILADYELNLLSSSYDIVGDIAILRIPKELEERKEVIAGAVMDLNKHVKAVYCQVGAVSGLFRLRKLEWIGGEKRTTTIHKEYGCQFKVDLAACYFSPRLSYERMRIAKLIQPGEVVVNMFAGVGCYSVIIAKHSQVGRVYSIDLNPEAVRFTKENVHLNKVEGKVIPIEGDARRVIETALRGNVDRVIMPLPERAYEYLDSALMALKPVGGWIHYYDSTHVKRSEDPTEKIAVKAADKLKNLHVNFQINFSRVVRSIGPNWHQVVLDVLISKNCL